jgi:integrase
VAYSKESRRLTADIIAAIQTPGLHHDGDGLYLQTTAQPNGFAHSWVFRFRLAGINRNMGLGSYPAISIANARKLAGDARTKIQQGIDPVWEREANRMTAAARAEKEAKDRIETFGHVAEEWFDTQEPKWADKHRGTVTSQVRRFCAPIWNKPIRHLHEADVKAVLDPVWKTTPVTGSRLRHNIESVFALAIATSRHAGPNPARWEENFDAVFVAPSSLDIENFNPMPYDEVPAFAAKLRAVCGPAARALEFMLLTVIRPGKVRMARLNEIDLKRGTWKPPHTGKHKRSLEYPFEVPLSPRALKIVAEMRKTSDGEYIFAGRTGTNPIGEKEMLKVLRRLAPDYDVHGLRSSMRDWLGEETTYERELAEYALQHTVGNAVENVYRHGTGFKKRRDMMNDWSTFVGTPPTTDDEKVVPLRSA